MVAAIGPRSGSAYQRLTYDQAATRITDCRKLYDGGDEHGPLGEQPEAGMARLRYDLAVRAIGDYECRRAREEEPRSRSRELDSRDLGRGR